MSQVLVKCPKCGSKDLVHDKATQELHCNVCGWDFTEEDLEDD